MASKKAKEVQVEEVQVEEVQAALAEAVELTAEEQSVKDALNADDHIAALNELKSAETTSPTLATIIATFLALTAALGADAPATRHALGNLQNFKSARVKATKGPKATKEPKFNEVAELKKVLAEESPNFQPLLDNDKVSDELKIAIITYTTLSNLDIDQSVIDAARDTLTNFGSKGRRKASFGPVEEFNVELDGKTYKNLSAAIYAAGYTKEQIEQGKTARFCDVAWRAVRSKILVANIGDSIEYEGRSYKKVAPSADAIGGTRGRQKKEESTAESTPEAEDSYE